MNKHKQYLESITCPFAIEIQNVKWDDVKNFISIDDRENSVIIEMKNGEKFLINIPKILYEAIYKSGEENIMQRNFEFNDVRGIYEEDEGF